MRPYAVLTANGQFESLMENRQSNTQLNWRLDGSFVSNIYLLFQYYCYNTCLSKRNSFVLHVNEHAYYSEYIMDVGISDCPQKYPVVKIAH